MRRGEVNLQNGNYFTVEYQENTLHQKIKEKDSQTHTPLTEVPEISYAEFLLLLYGTSFDIFLELEIILNVRVPNSNDVHMLCLIFANFVKSEVLDCYVSLQPANVSPSARQTGGRQSS